MKVANLLKESNLDIEQTHLWYSGEALRVSESATIFAEEMGVL